MSLKVLTVVWECTPKVKGNELLLLLAMADNANDEYECFPSVKTLARKVRVTERYVQKMLRKMEKQGLLNIFEKSGIDYGQGCTNRYRLNREALRGVSVSSPVGVSPGSSLPVSPGSPVGVNNEGGRGELASSDKPSIKPSVIISKDDIAEKVYLEYPRKEAKQAGLRAIRAAIRRKDCSVEELLERTIEYADAMKSNGIGLASMPHASTWFNGARYNDGADAWIRTAKTSMGSRERSPDCDRRKNESEEDYRNRYAL